MGTPHPRRHPYSRRVRIGDMGMFNYIRNSVKATVDAYDGNVNMYVFEPNDPIIRAWQAMFPTLFKPASEMPQALRPHVRYSESLFRGQTEIYRAFHMQAPEAFYNKEDLWDVAKNVYSQAQPAEGLAPTYIVATLPGRTKPEFLLLQSFTPRSKDNLISVMAARCDPEHYGEIVVLLLSKQSLIYGPLQIESRIDSDQNISKDLSLMESTGVASIARANAGAADRQHVPVRRADLHPVVPGEDAAIEEGRAGDGQYT